MKCIDNFCMPIEWNNDSECLFNKYIDNCCTFDDENTVVYYDDIYIYI